MPLKTVTLTAKTTKANKRLARKAAKQLGMTLSAYVENCVMSSVAFLFPDAP